MLDQLLEKPWVALGIIVFVVYLLLFYIGQREKAQVSQMRGSGRFRPGWSSGRKHHRRRPRRRGGGEFKPQWNRAESKTQKKPPEPSTKESEPKS